MRKINSLIIIAYSAGIVYPAGACFMSCFGGRATCGCCIPQQIGPEPEIKAIQEKIEEHDATLKIIKEKVFAEPIAKNTRQLGVDFGMVNGKYVETNGSKEELENFFEFKNSKVTLKNNAMYTNLYDTPSYVPFHNDYIKFCKLNNVKPAF